MGAIGSIKNRLKTWWRNIRRRKKEEQEEEEEQKKKTLSRPKVLLYFITGLFTGILESVLLKPKSKREDIVSIQPQLSELEYEIQDLLSQLTEEQQSVREEVIDNETTIFIVEQQKKVNAIQEKMNVLKEKIHTLEKIAKIESRKKKKKNTALQSHRLDEINGQYHYIAVEQKRIEEIVENAIHIQEEKREEKAKINTEKRKYYQELKEYLENSNQVLDKFDRKISCYQEKCTNEELEGRIDDISNLYDEIFLYTLKESAMRGRIPFSIFQDDQRLKQIDHAGFLTAEGVFQSRLGILQSIRHLRLVEWNTSNIAKEKKKELETMQHTANHLQSEKKKLEQKILEQRVMMSSLEKSMHRLRGPKRRIGLLSRLKAIGKNTLFIGIGFTVFSRTKKTVFQTLGSVLLVDHGLRGMRNLFRKKEEKISYFDIKKILKQVHSEIDALKLSESFYEDARYQLDVLRKEIENHFPKSNDIEILTLQNDLEQLDDHLKRQERQLQLELEVLDTSYQRERIKVKALEEK